jgi:hypothetical protein
MGAEVGQLQSHTAGIGPDQVAHGLGAETPGEPSLYLFLAKVGIGAAEFAPQGITAARRHNRCF